ncbi:MAG: TIGR04283 family arsenosugar biosynthesis glycosyltransferase [Verrucomicrobia bacterium]|nr:TIGR04283 family arsenosugar biosynthesis glycosyltransferase [Verrucomicrobiota bacterium]
MTKSRAWIRLGCIAVSAVALFVVFRGVDVGALAATFRNLHIGWFVAAIVLYGLIFLPGAWRWHLMLRLTGSTVHLAATARVALIGHFFYTLLFGAVGGDVAKSALYARWYRLPAAVVFGAAPLDRLLGFCGLVVFAALAFTLATVNGAFVNGETIAWRWPVSWAWAILGLAAVCLGLLLRGRDEPAWTRWARVLVEGGQRLIASPRIATQGLLCGFLVQAALSGVLALNLEAVARSPLPWGKLIWTLPAISAVSALPMTVSGLGVREGASLALLGLYGISPADAVAASLLTFLVSLFWASMGAVLFWRGDDRQAQPRSLPETISVVIPALNEAESLGETVRRAKQIPEVCEIIVVDGGSRDQTREVAINMGCHVLTSAPGRGGQMRLGAAQAKGDVILMLHADTWLPPNAGQAAINSFRDARVVGGGYWKMFRDGSPLLWGSRFKCAVRLYLGQRVAGDQALFVRREDLEAVGGVPDLPLMEEFELCRRLRQRGRLALADATLVTSARRFAKLGVLRTYLRMWRVTTQYRLGTSPQELRRIYERE